MNKQEYIPPQLTKYPFFASINGVKYVILNNCMKRRARVAMQRSSR